MLVVKNYNEGGEGEGGRQRGHCKADKRERDFHGFLKNPKQM